MLKGGFSALAPSLDEDFKRALDEQRDYVKNPELCEGGEEWGVTLFCGNWLEVIADEEEDGEQCENQEGEPDSADILLHGIGFRL